MTNPCKKFSVNININSTSNQIIYFVLFFSICRRFGTKCAGCSQGISPNDLVRRARSKVFHLKCFTCMVCRKQLSTGEELYVLDENKFICKDDYLHSKFSGKCNFLLTVFALLLFRCHLNVELYVRSVTHLVNICCIFKSFILFKVFAKDLAGIHYTICSLQLDNLLWNCY